MLHHSVAQVRDVDNGMGGAAGAGPTHEQRAEVGGAGGEDEPVSLGSVTLSCLLVTHETHLEQLPSRAADGDVR